VLVAAEGLAAVEAPEVIQKLKLIYQLAHIA
jgi:hypothetical protein